ncbi:MAG: hypothetical protein K9W46_02620 [Candidatus Heimdallarchaeum endolithica]|uniref:Uncharacterized protein n=1 Tax=Candidatus Heimdallarchaeum endolithica TaxID=2876572 RepID=A0A9Y1FPZ6_9ARCH|nr:MAG: hypothetical protein K9W46_02620 [Candidatus Heimdallarchaeum endolithica]
MQRVDLTPLKELMEKGQLDVEIDSHVKKLNLEPETEIEQEQKIGDADSQVKKAFREQEQMTEQKRLQKLKRVMKRTEKITIDNLSPLLGFTKKVDCLEWIYILPDEYEIVVDGDYIMFGQKSSEKIDEALERLSQEFESWETKDKTDKV